MFRKIYFTVIFNIILNIDLLSNLEVVKNIILRVDFFKT